MNQPMAYVHPEAKIGENVVIDPFAMIHKNVEIGDGTWIGSNVTIMEGARIGKNCKIFPGAVIAAIPQDLKFQGEKSMVTIGDNTTIRECATVNRGTSARGTTKVGSNCLLMAYSHVAHDCELGDHVIIGNATQIAGEVEIDDWAIISAACGVHQFTRIGKHVMIQGLSGVGKDVPPYVTAGRNPIAYAGLNSVGLRRRNFPGEKINEIQEIYRAIYLRGMNTSDALVYIEENLAQTAERDEILNFIRESKRGIIRGLLD
ncbi:MAG TPA: acyl-ACP--UDP-N-acetylglucosamine O-acyltransferase [Bacteroidales bacterium]|nr:acyl-ACP--UDP-N-acetylglucosamine O-acyltransferase [Bacteroidales bacterium]